MKLKKCKKCKTYTLEKNCPECKKKSSDAHYTYNKIKDALPSTAEHFNKRRGIKTN